MTYCDLGCRRPADILHGAQKLCAHHYLSTDVGRQLGGARG